MKKTTLKNKIGVCLVTYFMAAGMMTTCVTLVNSLLTKSES